LGLYLNEKFKTVQVKNKGATEEGKTLTQIRRGSTALRRRGAPRKFSR